MFSVCRFTWQSISARAGEYSSKPTLQTGKPATPSRRRSRGTPRTLLPVRPSHLPEPCARPGWARPRKLTPRLDTSWSVENNLRERRCGHGVRRESTMTGGETHADRCVASLFVDNIRSRGRSTMNGQRSLPIPSTFHSRRSLT